MVYSNAVYFASHFDQLTDKVRSTLNVKQKLQKNMKLDKSTLAKSLCIPHEKDHPKNLTRTHKRKDSEYPTRERNNNPAYRDSDYKNCN